MYIVRSFGLKLYLCKLFPAPFYIVLVGLVQLFLNPQVDQQFLVGEALQKIKGFLLALLIELDMGLKDLRPLLCQLQVIEPVVVRVSNLLHKAFGPQFSYDLGTGAGCFV